jgi:cellulose synthase/poly-beta-1,6-N-acetylglucosamine synthase-like glycosyltransferase
MLEALAWLAAVPPAAALVTYSLEVLAGLRRMRETKRSALPRSAAILVPAHNEASTIGDSVRELLPICSREVRLLVVADNCSDATAQIARDAGADVIERTDPGRRGKGFALAFGRDRLAADPPEVVMILDADCRTDRQSIERLISSAFSLQAPVQASNLLTAPPDADPIVQISNFAMLIKNSVRARGLYRLGGGAPLFGTGMAFPWSIFRNAPLASADTVEDLRLCLDLASQGVAVHLVESARVTSASAAPRDTVAQRRRWEQGFVRIATKHAVPLFVQGAMRLSRHRIALGMHLCVPPLALLLLLGTGASLATLAIGLSTDYWPPLWTIVSAMVVALATTLLAWWKEGRGVLAPRSIARAPRYIFSKLPIYLGLFTAHPARWNRTPRDGDHR